MNRSDWPHERIAGFKALLKGGTVIPQDRDAITIIRSLPHGHVDAVLGTARKIGLDRLLGPKPAPAQAGGNRCRNLILALVVNRILDPGSKLAAARALSPDTATSSRGEQLALGVVDEDELYSALDWLAVRQPAIEAALAKRHFTGGTLVLYDDATPTYCFPFAVKPGKRVDIIPEWRAKSFRNAERDQIGTVDDIIADSRTTSPAIRRWRGVQCRKQRKVLGLPS